MNKSNKDEQKDKKEQLNIKQGKWTSGVQSVARVMHAGNDYQTSCCQPDSACNATKLQSKRDVFRYT